MRPLSSGEPRTNNSVTVPTCTVTQWYHPACLALSAASLEILLRLPSWRCPECQAAISRRAATHRQLQLPIPSSTKFCEVSPGMQ